VRKVIDLSASAAKTKRATTVSLLWSGASGSSVQLRRDGKVISTTPNDGNTLDSLPKTATGTRTYTVCETVSTACSPVVAVVVG
jgi:hypothetical protein